MRIPHDQYGRALRGEKTLHLYPRHPYRPKPFRVGYSYPINTVTQDTTGHRSVSTERFRVRVMALGRTPIEDLPTPLVQMAGWDNPDALMGWWSDWYGKRPEAWLIWFVAIEKARFPASIHRNRHDDHGYTTVPLPGDDTLEAPPEQWLERQAEHAYRRDDELRRSRAEQRQRARARARRITPAQNRSAITNSQISTTTVQAVMKATAAPITANLAAGCTIHPSC